MSWRFRKTIKILPGVRINLGKRGASVSAGVPGARVTVGKDHITRSVGLPGTGLSNVTRTPRSSDDELGPLAKVGGIIAIIVVLWVLGRMAGVF